MKKLLLSISLIAMCASPSYAWDTQPPPPVKHHHAPKFIIKNNNVVKNHSKATSTATSHAQASATAKQKQHQRQAQKQSMKNSGNQAVNVEGDDYEASAFASGAVGNSTAPCVKSNAIWAGTVGFTGGISLASESHNCLNEREAYAAAEMADRAGLNGGIVGLQVMASQNPAMCHLMAQYNIVDCRPRNGGWRAFTNQTQPGQIGK